MSGVLTYLSGFRQPTSGGGGGFAVLGHNAYSPNGGSATTPWTLNTTGAGTIIIYAGDYIGYLPTSFSDSAGNTYSAGTAYGSNQGGRFFYKNAPTTGSSVSFTANFSGGDTRGFYGMLVLSGGIASPLDQQNGSADDSSGSNTRQPGSVTPTNDNQIVVTGIFCYQAGAAPTISSPYTVTDAVALSGHIGMGGMAYSIQTSATATNPTWTSVGIGGTTVTSVIATFKSQ